MNLNELKEELDKVVNDQDFSRAAEIKQNISELEHERSQILNAAEPEIEEIRTEKVKLYVSVPLLEVGSFLLALQFSLPF